MKENNLIKGTIIRTVFVGLEVIALVAISIYSFINAGTGIWGYWGSLMAIFGLLSPIFAYVIPSAVFNTFNLIVVMRNRHTPDSIKKYHKLSKAYLIWGIITGGLYGCTLIPVFLFENIFLFNGYKREIELIKNT